MYKWITIAIVFLALVACRKNNDAALAEKSVTKTFEFHVHAQQAYTDATYRNVNADVKLEIYKINYLTGAASLLWDTTFAARPLAAYPYLPQKFLLEKSFEVMEKSEKLQAKYTIRYTSSQGNSQQVRAEELVPGDSFAFLDVDI